MVPAQESGSATHKKLTATAQVPRPASEDILVVHFEETAATAWEDSDPQPPKVALATCRTTRAQNHGGMSTFQLLLQKDMLGKRYYFPFKNADLSTIPNSGRPANSLPFLIKFRTHCRILTERGRIHRHDIQTVHWRGCGSGRDSSVGPDVSVGPDTKALKEQTSSLTDSSFVRTSCNINFCCDKVCSSLPISSQCPASCFCNHSGVQCRCCGSFVLCCAVLCCVVLCCVVLCFVVFLCVVLCVLCCSVLVLWVLLGCSGCCLMLLKVRTDPMCRNTLALTIRLGKKKNEVRGKDRTPRTRASTHKEKVDPVGTTPPPLLAHGHQRVFDVLLKDERPFNREHQQSELASLRDEEQLLLT